MRAILVSCSALALAACGSEVEPETAETLEEELPVEEAVVDEEPVAELGSTYSELADCEVIERGGEDASYVKRRCEGHANYDLIVTTSDLRDEITLVDEEGEETPLDLTAQIADGAFNSLGKTVEWRGATPDAPDVLIARMNVADATDPMAADTSYLAVVRLEAPACVVARVPPGPGQNVAARRFADRETLPDCLGAESDDEAPAQE